MEGLTFPPRGTKHSGEPAATEQTLFALSLGPGSSRHSEHRVWRACRPGSGEHANSLLADVIAVGSCRQQESAGVSEGPVSTNQGDARTRLVSGERYRFGSWVILGLSLVLAAFALSRRATHPTGEWREVVSGPPLQAVPLLDLVGNPVELRHPSVWYFFTHTCSHCRKAHQQLNNFLERHSEGALDVYAVTNDSTLPTTSFSSDYHQAIKVARLNSPSPPLHFVTEVPMLVRTDSLGHVVLRYVGVPDHRVLEAMLLQGKGQPGSMISMNP